MKRSLMIFTGLLLVGVYLFVLGWTGLGFVSYATVGDSLSLQAHDPQSVVLGETAAFELEGRGFSEKTRVHLQMDVNNQDAIVGTFPQEEALFDMERVGNLLYLSGSNAGIRILDISNPLSPSMPVPPQLLRTSVIDIERVDNTLYLSCGMQGVKIAQIRDLGGVSTKVTLHTWSAAIASKVVGHYLYVVAGKGKLLVYDLDNLTDKQPAAVLELKEHIRGIGAFGDYLYLVAGMDGVLIYKIGDSGVPVLSAQLPVKKRARSITIADGQLYLLQPGKVSQYDLAEPAAPKLVAEQLHFSRPAKLYHAGEKIYVCDNVSGLGLIDNREGILPATVDFLNVGGDPRSVITVGDYLYVAVSNVGVRILDPKAILPRQVVHTIGTPSGVKDFSIVDDYMYIIDNTQGLYLKKLSEPATALTRISSLPAKSLALAGNFLYVTGKSSGVEVFDVSDPGAPAPIAYWANLIVSSPAVAGQYLVSCGVDEELVLIDISNPLVPKVVNRQARIDGTRLFVWNDIVAVAGKNEGVLFYRIKNGEIIFLSQLKLPFPLDRFSEALDVQIIDGIGYVANGEGGLLIVDLENPEKPKILSSLSLQGVAMAVQVYGDEAYVTCRYSGLYKIDISDRRAPKILTSIAFSDLSGKPKIHDGLLYLSNRYMGVTAIPIPYELEAGFMRSSGKLRVTVPSPAFPGRYSLQVRNSGESASLDGVLRYR